MSCKLTTEPSHTAAAHSMESTHETKAGADARPIDSSAAAQLSNADTDEASDQTEPFVEDADADDAAPVINRSNKHSRKRRQTELADAAPSSNTLSMSCTATAASSNSDEPGPKLARSNAATAAASAAAPSPFDDDSFGADDAAAAPMPRFRKMKAASNAAASSAAAAAAALPASPSPPVAAAASASSASAEEGEAAGSPPAVDHSNRTPRTFLIHSPLYASLLDLQSVHQKRMKYYSSLLRSLRSDRWPGLTILSPRRATMSEMEMFHSREYLQFFQHICTKYTRHDTGVVEQTGSISAAEREDQERFGLIDDCAVFPEAFSMAQFICGGTLRAVECLLLSMARRPLAPVTAVHFGGGRHHAESECAKGFCFCGDAVLACLQLLASDAISRVLYLDIDLHHGDGVERAFAASASVMTVSMHHYAPGFFPTTGALDPEGDGAGPAKYSLINLPLRAGIDDASFCALFDQMLAIVLPSFRPSAVVVCAGVDGLASDRMSPFNLTSRAYAKCVQQLKKRLGHFRAQEEQAEEEERKAKAFAEAAEAKAKFNADALYDDEEDSADEAGVASASSSSATKGAPAEEKSATAAAAPAASYPSAPIPLLLLGGGGYCPTDSARAFVAMTAAACSQPLPASLPDSESLLTHYLPNLQLHSQSKPVASRPNENDRAYLLKLVQHVRLTCSRRERLEKMEELEMT